MDKTRILQVVPTLYPTLSFGGGSIVAWELGKTLEGGGNPVCIISTDAGDGGRTPSGRFDEGGMTVYRARNLSNSLAYQFKLFLPMMSPRRIRDEVRAADVVHMHDFRTLLNIIVGKIALDEGKPVVVQPHGTIRGDYLGRRGLKRIIDSTVGNGMAKRVSAWIALSEAERVHLIKFGIPEDRVKVIPNGIDLQRLEGGLGKDAARKDLGIDPRKKLLLFIGRIHPIKGLDLFIECMHDIAETENDIVAVIAGPDDGALPQLKDMTRRLALSDRVTFKGVVSGDEKLNLLHAADAFILPSEKEAFPISLLEACAAGLPVVTTRNSDIAMEMDGKCGLAVERNKKEFTEAILKVVAAGGSMSRFASSSKAYASKYSWEKVVGDYIRLYESVIQKGAEAH